MVSGRIMLIIVSHVVLLWSLLTGWLYGELVIGQPLLPEDPENNEAFIQAERIKNDVFTEFYGFEAPYMPAASRLYSLLNEIPANLPIFKEVTPSDLEYPQAASILHDLIDLYVKKPQAEKPILLKVMTMGIERGMDVNDGNGEINGVPLFFKAILIRELSLTQLILVSDEVEFICS